MKETFCCFTGHRLLPESEIAAIRLKLSGIIETLFEAGVTTFITGGAKGFDTLAAETVLAATEYHPGIQLWVVLPYSGIRGDSTYLSQADRIDMLSEAYYRGCMHTRNRFMVEHAAYCISYLRKESGGTFYTVNYAKRRGLHIINI